jgi:hypothetical protein
MIGRAREKIMADDAELARLDAEPAGAREKR